MRALSPESPHQPPPLGESEATVRHQIRGPMLADLARRVSLNQGAAAALLARALVRTFRQLAELAQDVGSARGRQALAVELRAIGRGVAGASALLHACARNHCSPWHWVERWARERPNQRAIADESTEVSWAELKARAEILADRLAFSGLGTRQTTAVLLAENSVFLVVALLAIQRAGASPVLLNFGSDIPLLPFAIQRTGAEMVLVEREQDLHALADCSITCVAADSLIASASEVHRADALGLPRGGQCFAILMTSGTTDQPKPVTISQSRAALSGYGMGVMCLAHGARDTIYCVLPLAHATGLMTALCPALVTGCGLALRRRFSARDFWRDARQQRATSVIYVGEIVRRLMATKPSELDVEHGVKTLYGNGMPLAEWHRIQARFAVANILEFYGATELPLALVNLAGVPGYVGRIALPELSPWQIVRTNAHGDPEHDRLGRPEPCAAGEPGELVLMKRLRTGDIVVRDVNGYVRHLDRQPGVFRQNGHNVSSKAVQTTLQATAGIAALGVTHVQLSSYDGQAGLLVVVPGQGFELRALEEAYRRLPKPQRPRFVRLTNALQLNRGLKFDESAYRRAGVDPEWVSDPLFVYGPSGFVAIDSVVWRELQLGTFRF